MIACAPALRLGELLAGFLRFFLREFQLLAQFVERQHEVVATNTRRPGVGRIGEMGGIADIRPLFLRPDLSIEVIGHAREFGDHRLQLNDLPSFFICLKFLQAHQCIPRLHHSALRYARRIAPDTNTSFKFARQGDYASRRLLLGYWQPKFLTAPLNAFNH